TDHVYKEAQRLGGRAEVLFSLCSDLNGWPPGAASMYFDRRSHSRATQPAQIQNGSARPPRPSCLLVNVTPLSTRPPPGIRRECDRERGAAGRAVRGVNAAAVELDEVAHDRQSQPGAARIPAVARARLVHAIEALEDARQIGRRDAGPFVGDRDRDA